ncbi:MAG: tRNA-uridine aminocarboxypropyltransferase [Rhodoferax sp.]|uniref:tRNA-uridine aminocarboxypropyltransferase n=1 Tax=Rhodoferax sp. TaxID=50421 RepID=UPI002727D4F5|nr:tRNA-uridine aminocarboxypropyltransferase [Rhodoferax sp.]MDO8447429.1 tRNA-uridine aminocarboxypropyltransferase [Rhodoferax sp.]
MLPAPDTKRPSCAICMRPLSACICQWIKPISHVVEVVVLQHPLEVANAKGSARLLCLSLPHSRLVTGEEFDRQELQALLTAPLQPQTEAGSPKQAILLYPDTLDDPASRLPTPPALPRTLLRDPSQLRLIVLDGTWRKSRKMLYLNPLLQQLPRLSLRDTPPSHYLIRKAHRPDQLSTLESTCAALMQLEGSVERFQPLLTAFDGFVAQQMAHHQASRASRRPENCQRASGGKKLR